MNDLPEDLASPRRERASDIANLVTGSILLIIVAGLIAAWLVTS
jgi:hypothetical protein